MFGSKNYDEQINKIIEKLNSNTKQIDECIKSINRLHELFGELQNTMIAAAKVQAQHGAIVKFLVNHATVDSESQEDAERMMQDIMKNEKEARKALGEK